MAKTVYLSPSTQEKNKGYGKYGTEEQRMNEIGDVVQEILKGHGITVFRNKPEWILEQVVSDSNNRKPDIHFAIHSNAGGGRGCEVFAYAPGGEGEKVARNVYAEMEPLTPSTDRGVKFNSAFYELRKTKAPAALVEVAFHDNKEDAEWIVANTNQIGQAIARGILKYFGITPRETELTLEKAVEILRAKGIIQNPDYWLKYALPGETVKGGNAALLIKRVALVLKEGSLL
jgi:N-acetylmuramoyl-L-alanine amidase